MKLHLKLPSGRVIVLKEELTPDEEEATRDPANIPILEALADMIASRCKMHLDSDGEEGRELLRRHGIEFDGQ